MAEITAPVVGGGKHRRAGGLRRIKKLSTKVDLTPMVDLGFLLITFFIVTASWKTPKVMKLFLPEDKGAPMPAGESTALTVIPLSGNRIFYFHGDLPDAVRQGAWGITGFSVEEGIGKIIRSKQAALDHHSGYSRKDLLLIIKPSAQASYGEVVKTLDEVLINDLTHYAFVDLSAAEKKAMEDLQIH